MVGVSAPSGESAARPVPTHLPTLTSVRFLAAAWVVLYHYESEILAHLPGLRTFTVGGATGVSLFYVLSGFILAHTYWERDVRSARGVRDFFVHRLARIYPMYVLSLVLVLPRLLLYRSDPHVQYAYAHPWLTTLSHLTLTHNWFYDPIDVLNGPTWSVGCEAGFYVLFPSLVPLVRRVSARGALVGMAAIFVISAVLPLLYNRSAFAWAAEAWGLPYTAAFDVRVNQAIRMWPILRLGEFAIGMLVAALWRRHADWNSAQRRALLGFVAAAFAGFVLLFRGESLHNALFVQQVLPVPFFAAAILALAVFGGARPRALAGPLLILLGEASYSLYLLHIPAKHAFRIVGERLGLPMASLPAIAVSLVGSVLLSILAYRYVETPARRWIVARYAPRRPRADASRADEPRSDDPRADEPRAAAPA